MKTEIWSLRTCTSYSRTTSWQIAAHHLLKMCLSTPITFPYSQQKKDLSGKNKLRKRGFQFETTSSIAVTPVQKEKEKKKKKKFLTLILKKSTHVSPEVHSNFPSFKRSKCSHDLKVPTYPKRVKIHRFTSRSISKQRNVTDIQFKKTWKSSKLTRNRRQESRHRTS